MKAIHNISYGIYVLTAKTDKNNGCIINTLMQVTSTPEQVSVTVNKSNETTRMIMETGKFNVSILDQNTKFDLIQRFGFSTGKTVDKFVGFLGYSIAENGIPYITQNTCAYISVKVNNVVDVGTHITFIGEIVEDVVLARTKPMTYDYYFNFVKPKTEVKRTNGYVCNICGYVYEGEVLPDDFICPICKHGAQDFEKIEEQTKVVKKKFYCPVCDTIEESEENKEFCSVCGATLIELEG